MDNVSKALQIAGGVLIGVILLSLVSYFFSSIGLWPEEEEQIETAEQTAKFNLEYEVYDKKGMYGVDVISCLNKAKSNNEKYVEGGSFLTGTRYGADFYVDVWVRLTKKPLEESLEIYYFDTQGSQRQLFSTEPIQVDNSTLHMQDVGFNIKEDYYTSFSNDDEVFVRSYEFTESTDLLPDTGEFEDDTGKNEFNSNKYYSLLDNDGNNNLVELLNLSNRTDTGSLDRIVTNSTGANLDVWSRIIWKTALSDFKKRKFKCDFVGYSSKTGRVNEVYFSEI